MLNIDNIQKISEMKELFAVGAKGSEMLIDVCHRFFTKNFRRQLFFVKINYPAASRRGMIRNFFLSRSKLRGI